MSRVTANGAEGIRAGINEYEQSGRINKCIGNNVFIEEMPRWTRKKG